jgi:hypothetical protein
MQKVHHVGRHTRIPVLLDHDGRGGSLCVNAHQSIPETAFPGRFTYLGGDIYEFFPAVSGYLDQGSHCLLRITLENILSVYTLSDIIVLKPVLLKMHQRMHAVLGEPFTTLQFIQFNDKGTGGNFSAQSFDEPAARGSGSTSG